MKRKIKVITFYKRGDEEFKFNVTKNNKVKTHHINLFKTQRNCLWLLNIYYEKTMGGRKHSLNLVGPGQGQRPPVFFYTVYKFENHLYILY